MVINDIFAPCTTAAASTPQLWMPMIQGVSVSDSTDPNRPNIIENNLVALIDTGSDYCRIDANLAAKHSSLTQIGTMNALGATGPGAEKIFSLQIIFGQVRFQSACATAVLRSGGSLFDLLLGMDAIRFFDLNIVRSRHLVTLSMTDSQTDR
jgi:hypothetical protein